MPFPLQVDSLQTAADLNDLLRDHRGGLLNVRPDPRNINRRDPSRAAIAFVLLEDLESGGNAQAFVLRKSPRPVQIVTLKGNVSGGSFGLHYGTPVVSGGPEASGAIDYDFSAAELTSALEECLTIGPGGVRVTLGKTSYINDEVIATTVTTGRWFVEFQEIAAPLLLTPFETTSIILTGSPNDITAETHFLSVTDKQETIHSLIPVPDDGGTPQKMGSIGSAHWLHGIGWCVDALECHNFTIVTEAAAS